MREIEEKEDIEEEQDQKGPDTVRGRGNDGGEAEGEGEGGESQVVRGGGEEGRGNSEGALVTFYGDHTGVGLIR